MYISVFISIIIFFFIRVEYIPMRLLIRILLIPVVLGISYEILRLAGRSENIFVYMITAPGIWFQHLTTREPDAKQIEVAIASVEAVFDWKKYLADNFGFDIDENGEVVGTVPGWGEENEVYADEDDYFEGEDDLVYAEDEQDYYSDEEAEEQPEEEE